MLFNAKGRYNVMIITDNDSLDHFLSTCSISTNIQISQMKINVVKRGYCEYQ